MSKTTTTKAASDLETLTADLTRLDSLIEKSELSEEEDASVAELLNRLESAEGLAGVLEARVDGILGELDGMMEAMGEQEKLQSQGSSDVQPTHD